MAVTNNLGIPLIETGQSQKEVTMNEAITILDAVVGGGVIDRLNTPPGSPAEGDRYIVTATATGAWAGKENNLTYYFNGGWRFIVPGDGLMVWVNDENLPYVYSGGVWAQFVEGVVSAHGATTGLHVIEEELTLSSGSTKDSTIAIPNRGICLGVSTRTTLAITGASSYDAGIVGETNKFGGSLGVALNSTNSGVIGPTAFYSPTTIRLTANGGNFSGGKVRIAIHYISCGVPQS